MNLPYLAWRLLQLVPTILGIVLISFVLIHAAPGDPILALAGEHGDAAYYAAMRERFGLDQPLPRQLASYAARVASGDFGFSYVQGRPVADLVLGRVTATLLLTATALLLAILLAIPLGVLAARRPHGTRDLLINAAAVGVYSAPVFWIGQLAILVLAFRLGLFPVHGMRTAGSDAAGLAAAGDVLRHLALPALVLAAQEVAMLARLTRSGLIEEMEMDYVRTARAKGLGERAVLLRHALPRALLPVLTVVGARAGHLIAGAAVIEIVFGWPGIGRLLLTALQTRDTPVLLGLFFLVSLTVVLANLLTDLAHAAVDPRIRFR